MDLGGLGNMMSAVPGGYQQGMQANNQIDQQQLQLVDQRAKQVGTAAYFRALQTMMGPQGGQGPQPPNPGQPSMSAHAMPGPQMTPPMAMNNGQPVTGADGGIMPPMQSQPASGAVAPAGPPGAQQSPPGVAAPGGQQLSWQGIIQSLKASNPNASDLELAHAVDHFMPMMTMQNRLEWQQMRNELMWEMTKMRMDTSRANTQDRADVQVRGQDVRAGTQATAEEGRNQRAYIVDDRQREREEGRNARAELSSTTKQEIAKLSANTRMEITRAQEEGRTGRAELSSAARREIAKLSVDARREIADIQEGGRQQRFDTAEQGRQARFDTAEGGRNRRADQTEGGRQQRAEMSANVRSSIAQLSREAQREIAEMNEAGRNQRADLSSNTRYEINRLGREQREELTQYLEGGRNARSGAMLEQRRDEAGQRESQFERRQQQQQDQFGTAENRRERGLTQRGDQFQQREQRLQDALQLRSDTNWARLDQQKQQLENRIRAGDHRQALIDWRATVDAQHKLAMEKIQATSVNNAMKPKEREQFLKDQNTWYRDEITRVKNMTTQRGNLTDNNSVVTGQSTRDLPAVNAPPTVPLPPAFKADPDGTKYQKGGKTWIKQGDQLIPFDQRSDSGEYQVAGDVVPFPITDKVRQIYKEMSPTERDPRRPITPIIPLQPPTQRG